MKTLYDVCCDYSLDINVSEESRRAAKSGYKWIKRTIDNIKVEVGFHIKHKEIHYLRADNNKLHGLSI